MGFGKETLAANHLFGANLAWVAAACFVVTTPGMAQQDGRTGVSVPQPVLSIDTSSTNPDSPSPKPSAAIPTPVANAPAVYGPYIPYRAAGTPSAPANQPFDPDAAIVTPDTLHRHSPSALQPTASNDPDAGIVTRVLSRPDEINDGTLLKVRLRESISTLTAQPGTRFTADVTDPITQDGRVYIPAGSVLNGRITSAYGGRRIGGGAAIHLEPDSVTLPDGTMYQVHARVIDTSSWQNTTVDHEGTIRRRDNAKESAAVSGLTTGGAIAAGAIIAGPPGALIGAGIGVGATAIVWLKQDRQATLPKDLGLIFSLTAPLAVNPSRAALPSTAITSRTGGE